MDEALELAGQHLTEKCPTDVGGQCDICDKLCKLFGCDEWVLAYVDAKYKTEEQNG